MDESFSENLKYEDIDVIPERKLRERSKIM